MIHRVYDQVCKTYEFQYVQSEINAWFLIILQLASILIRFFFKFCILKTRIYTFLCIKPPPWVKRITTIIFQSWTQEFQNGRGNWGTETRLGLIEVCREAASRSMKNKGWTHLKLMNSDKIWQHIVQCFVWWTISTTYKQQNNLTCNCHICKF